MKKRTFLSLIAALLASSSIASAHQQVTFDADDSDGPLDIVASDVRHPEGEHRFRVITYEKWSLRKLEGPHTFITFELRHATIAGAEACVVVDAVEEDGELSPIGRVYNERSGCSYFDDHFVANVDVRRRKAHHAVIVTVPNALLPNSAISWRAVSAFERDGHQACPTPDPHGDGGYGTCTDKTKWRRNTDN